MQQKTGVKTPLNGHPNYVDYGARQSWRLIEGQGRWRMHAQEPGDMWIKYRQAKVEEKRTVSDL